MHTGCCFCFLGGEYQLRVEAGILFVRAVAQGEKPAPYLPLCSVPVLISLRVAIFEGENRADILNAQRDIIYHSLSFHFPPSGWIQNYTIVSWRSLPSILAGESVTCIPD